MTLPTSTAGTPFSQIVFSMNITWKAVRHNEQSTFILWRTSWAERQRRHSIILRGGKSSFKHKCTDKKKKKNLLIYKEIQNGAFAKSYVRKGFLIYEEMRKYLIKNEESVSHIWLCNCSVLNFLIYEENLIFFFISVESTSPCKTHLLPAHWSGAAAHWFDLYIFRQEPVLTL